MIIVLFIHNRLCLLCYEWANYGQNISPGTPLKGEGFVSRQAHASAQ